jgi:hypothetical protein
MDAGEVPARQFISTHTVHEGPLAYSSDRGIDSADVRAQVFAGTMHLCISVSASL